MRVTAPIWLLLALVTLTFCACEKYDEGPAFSLRSKTFRATNDWHIDKASKNGIDITPGVRIGANLKSDGTVEYRDTVATPDGDVIAIQNGLWEFDKDAENLLLVFTNPGGGTTGAKVWYILRLTSDELWVTETTTDQDLYRYEFVPKK